MNMRSNFFIAFLLIFYTCSVFAGTSYLSVILVNIGDTSFINSPIFKKYLENLNNQELKSDRCWGHFGEGGNGIGQMTITKLPPGINTELARSIFFGDREALELARKIMHKEDEFTSRSGYDGMFIIKPENGQLTIMAIGANVNPKKGMTGISPILRDIKLDQTFPSVGAKIFERSLCRVTKPFAIDSRGALHVH